jgi:hypothetical protein
VDAPIKDKNTWKDVKKLIVYLFVGLEAIESFKEIKVLTNGDVWNEAHVGDHLYIM